MDYTVYKQVYAWSSGYCSRNCFKQCFF